MTLRAIVSVLTVLLLSPLAPVRAAAQDVDGARLPAVRVSVNLERVKRKLAALPASDTERSLLNLDYYLEVFRELHELTSPEWLDGFFTAIEEDLSRYDDALRAAGETAEISPGTDD